MVVRRATKRKYGKHNGKIEESRRKLHNEEDSNFFFFARDDQIAEVKVGSTYTWDNYLTYTTVLGGKAKGKGPLQDSAVDRRIIVNGKQGV
jgi:hypothetical protein